MSLIGPLPSPPPAVADQPTGLGYRPTYVLGAAVFGSRTTQGNRSVGGILPDRFAGGEAPSAGQGSEDKPRDRQGFDAKRAYRIAMDNRVFDEELGIPEAISDGTLFAAGPDAGAFGVDRRFGEALVMLLTEPRVALIEAIKRFQNSSRKSAPNEVPIPAVEAWLDALGKQTSRVPSLASLEEAGPLPSTELGLLYAHRKISTQLAARMMRNALTDQDVRGLGPTFTASTLKELSDERWTSDARKQRAFILRFEQAGGGWR